MRRWKLKPIKQVLYSHGISLRKACLAINRKRELLRRADKAGSLTTRTLLRLCNTLGIPPAEFFEEVEDMK